MTELNAVNFIRFSWWVYWTVPSVFSLGAKKGVWKRTLRHVGLGQVSLNVKGGRQVEGEEGGRGGGACDKAGILHESPPLKTFSGLEVCVLNVFSLSGAIRANRKFERFGRIGLTRYKNRGFNCEWLARIDSRELHSESPVPLSRFLPSVLASSAGDNDSGCSILVCLIRDLHIA